MVVFGAIAPHGDPAFVEGSRTRTALEELGRRLERARPDVTVVVTPHNVHVEGTFAVVLSATIAGKLDLGSTEATESAGPGSAGAGAGKAEQEVELTAAVDQDLARTLLRALGDRGLPAAAISYGSNDLALAQMPMDWGTLIPLWFLGGNGEEPRPVLVLSPARELTLEDHIRAGEALADAGDGRRMAVIASADHGHAHDPDGPFGFDPAAAEYDARIVELVSENRLGDAAALEPIVEAAKADSLWQLVVLHGALGGGFDVELLAYDCPTYFGMLCAAFEPRAA